MPAPIELDLETEKILPRPQYPPRPVGLAVGWPGNGGRRYLAWGHPTENNSTEVEARQVIRDAFRSGLDVVFHNAAFDLDVIQLRLGVNPPPWHKVHDTMFLAFLVDPHSRKLELKPLAERYLDMPPDEQTELKEWIVTHVPEARRAKSQWGAYISRAPGKLVGRYAVGDVKRTGGLHRVLYREVREAGMLEAYDRERQLLPWLRLMERTGVGVATQRLKRDIRQWEGWQERSEAWLRKRLRAPDLDLNSNEELADALANRGFVDSFVYTAKGNRSTSKENIEAVINDEQTLRVLNYRSRLVNSIRNFGRPWLAMAEESGGRIYCRWNQVRSGDGNKQVGARTGRLSSTPNFQNPPKQPDLVAFSSKEAKALAAKAERLEVKVRQLPKELTGVSLPVIRDYVVPFKGHRFNIRDYSQQELRILGHFEDGVLLQAYLDNPWLDVHDLAQRLINEMLSTNFPRKPIKNTGFGLIYGMGVGKLAAQIEREVEVAKQLKSAYLNIFPGLNELTNDLKRRARRHEPIYTWGGRRYYVEEPRLIEGRMRTFDYKLLNVLVQGSAADCSKQAAINYFTELEGRRLVDANWEAAGEASIVLSVHDEFVESAAKGLADTTMAIMREAMESVKFDVPMLSDGKTSAVSWARAKGYQDNRAPWEVVA